MNILKTNFLFPSVIFPCVINGLFSTLLRGIFKKSHHELIIVPASIITKLTLMDPDDSNSHVEFIGDED